VVETTAIADGFVFAGWLSGRSWLLSSTKTFCKPTNHVISPTSVLLHS